jgi:hypothetical protein
LRFCPDVRGPRAANISYRQIDLIVIAIICDCDSWNEVEDFSESKKKWFSSFFDLEHCIPSLDTFERVFARFDPQKFESCFESWMSSLVEIPQGQLLALEGSASSILREDLGESGHTGFNTRRRS